MEGLKSLFWRDLVKTWLLYLRVGLYLVPFGLIYALGRIYGKLDSRVILAACLVSGLLSAYRLTARRKSTAIWRPSSHLIVAGQQIAAPTSGAPRYAQWAVADCLVQDAANVSVSIANLRKFLNQEQQLGSAGFNFSPQQGVLLVEYMVLSKHVSEEGISWNPTIQLGLNNRLSTGDSLMSAFLPAMPTTYCSNLPVGT